MRWMIRDPSHFPFTFHRAMQQEEGDKLVERYYTERAAVAARKRFNYFRHCVRAFPLSPSYANEARFTHRTKIVWNELAHMWELRLITSKSLREEMEVIEK